MNIRDGQGGGGEGLTGFVKPCLHDQFVHRLCVDDLGKTGGVEVPCPRIDGDVLQVEVCSNSRETDVAKPAQRFNSLAMTTLYKESTHHCSLIISKKSL